ncbi:MULTISPECIES: LysR family transcriptional regulator [Brevibacterium]|uniref:LysR family transcriptional regulator n=1 Tax=Brevibacterium aurantiacum TaxID=273384 RepID=A0A4Z0KH43_BREAU|nr:MULTISPECIES: LysR family transcriptional regulator [Brevibacterium]TGD38006.1 LysR family transcriptional regulator [Brevibacterium aurantiacum]
MDMSKLEAFILVAEEESFSAAADRIGTAQSTISSRIKELETALGHRLLLRSTRRVSLSPVGAAVLPAARTALSSLDAIRQVVDDLAGVRHGRIRLGIIAEATVPGLSRILADFASDFPGIDLVITSQSSDALERAIADGSLDIALVVRFGTTSLRWERLLHDSLIVVGDSPPQNGESAISFSKLHEARLIVLDGGVGVRQALETEARRAGISLNIVAQVATPAIAEELYARSIGWLVLPDSFAQGRGVPLVGEHGIEPQVDVGLVTGPDLHAPATEILVTRLIEGIGNH